MRRKYNDLLAKRAGMLAEAETLLKDGKREDYKSKMSEIGNINDEITEVKAFIDEQDRQFLERKDDPGEAKDKAAERGNTLMKGGSIALSAQEVRKACILPASPSRWRPPRWWNPRARAATSATASAIWSAPSSTRSTCRI